MTKKIKRPVAFLSAFAMVMAMLLYFPGGMFSTCFVLKASAEGITLTEPQKDDNGVYQIGTAGELYWFAACVNGTDGISQNRAACAVLTDNITVNSNVLNPDGTLNSTNGTDFTSWTPIGTSNSRAYTGTFDGQNHTISGLYFSGASTSNVGLFGYVRENGSVSNAGVKDSYFYAKLYVGGVCGQNYYGTITNCYNTGTVSAAFNASAALGGVCGQNYYGTITDCYNIGTVIGSQNSIQVGGVCGYNDSGTIENCYNTGAVNGSGQIGGVCGYNCAYSGTATITNCYNTGEVSGTDNVGGVCGNIDNSKGTVTIANCYNKGEVSATGDNAYVGGVCGENLNGTITNCYNTVKVTATGKNVCIGGVCGKDSGTIENCYNTGAVNGSGQIGGVCGWNTHIIRNCYFLSGTAEQGIGEDSASGSATIKTTYEMHTADFCGTLGYHSQFDENGFCGLCINGYQPACKTTHKYNIDGVEGFDEVYEISNTGQLYWFAQQVNNGNTSINAVLTANITVNSNLLSSLEYDEDGNVKNGDSFTRWTPIGNSSSNKYTGTFDGHRYTISGLYFNDSSADYVGLFGYNSSTIKNVGVIDSYFKGDYYVGGVCGVNLAYFAATSIATATIENCYNKSYVSGSEQVGGVCGRNVASSGTATIKNCYNTGEVSGTNNAGGVCGYNQYSTVENCYNKGSVSGAKYVGGVCGYNYESTVKNCYNTGEVSATGDNAYAYVGGVCGVHRTNYRTVTIENCYNEGTVSGSGDYVGGVCAYNWAYVHSVETRKETGAATATIKDCHNKKTVSGAKYVGGVCGYNYASVSDFGVGEGPITATIENCYNEGDVSGSSIVGGVCGYNYASVSDSGNGTITATIEKCYNKGDVIGSSIVGGVCGMNYASVSGSGKGTITATIENCYNEGGVKVDVSGAKYVGGVCGYNYAYSGTATIANCYYLSGKATGGINGTDLNGSAEVKTETQFKSGEVAYLLSQGENGSVWGQDLSTADSSPVLGGKKVLTNSDQSEFANDVMIYGQNAALDGTIDFNIYVAADDNYEWSAKIDGAEVTKPAKDENGLYKFTCKVAAKDMEKDIEFYINESIKATVSVKTYLDALDTSESTELEELVTAMENYGNAAKEFFSTDGKVAEVNSVTAENLSGYTFTKNDTPEGISYYGSSLLLKSETTVRHYFKLANGKSIGEFTFTVDGNTVTPVEKQGYYYIDIENISADKLGTGFTVSINGEDVITNYSALSYVYKVLDSDSTDDNLKNLVKTLYLYNQNALAYNAA